MSAGAVARRRRPAFELAADSPALPFVPLCMTAEQLASWEEMNDRVSGSQHAPIPCTDCPKSFAAEMRLIGRCNGTPRGSEEVRMEIHRVNEVRPDLVAITLSRPCEHCAHAPACVIKRELDGLDALPARLPELDAALTVTVRATVECAHYAKAKGTNGHAEAAQGGPKRVVSAETRQRMRDAQLSRAAERAAASA